MDTEMSTNVEELNNMQELSSNIQEELDNGKANDYDEANDIYTSQKNISNLENLKNIQLKQLDELKQLKEMQQKQNEEIKKVKVVENRKKLYDSMYQGLKQPLLIFVLYILIAYPKTQYYIGKIIPKFYSEQVSFLNVLVQALVLFNLLIFSKILISYM